MRKDHEKNNPESCWNKATENEMMFVLLQRDLAAPATIRFWVQERIRLGKNHGMNAQIQEAIMCARFMELNDVQR